MNDLIIAPVAAVLMIVIVLAASYIFIWRATFRASGYFRIRHNASRTKWFLEQYKSFDNSIYMYWLTISTHDSREEARLAMSDAVRKHQAEIDEIPR